jgi:hypothetical protein
VHGPLHSGSLRGSPFSAPIFCLLYLLPLPNTPNLSSSSSYTTSSVLYILSPSLPSSFISSLFPTFKQSSCHPPVPLCAWCPLAIGFHCHHSLVSCNKIFIHVPKD